MSVVMWLSAGDGYPPTPVVPSLRLRLPARRLVVDVVVTQINQSINQFITRHSTEARATMSLSQTEKERLKSVLENVNEWSSPTAQWKRVPEFWYRDRETTSSNVDVVRGDGKKTVMMMMMMMIKDFSKFFLSVFVLSRDFWIAAFLRISHFGRIIRIPLPLCLYVFICEVCLCTALSAACLLLR